MSILNLKRMLSISQYCQLKDEVLLPVNKTNRNQWVIARSLCLFSLFDFRHIPKEACKQALDFELQNHGPFENTSHYAVWSNGLAQVWMWDQKETQVLIEEHGAEVFEIVPETVLRPFSSTQDGVVMIEDLEGSIDLQFLCNGVLIGSCWNKSVPNESEVQQFIQGLVRLPNFPSFVDSYKVNELVKESVSVLPLTSQHWRKSSNQLASLKGFNFESLIITIGFAVLLGFVQWELISTYRINQQIETIENKIETNNELAGPNVTARAEAILTAEKNKQLIKLLDFPYQSSLMLTFGELISQQGDRLKEWKYNLNKLELVIEPSKTSSLLYVNLIQKLEQVKSVSSEPGRLKGQIKLLVELDLNREVKDE